MKNDNNDIDVFAEEFAEPQTREQRRMAVRYKHAMALVAAITAASTTAAEARAKLSTDNAPRIEYIVNMVQAPSMATILRNLR